MARRALFTAVLAFACAVSIAAARHPAGADEAPVRSFALHFANGRIQGPDTIRVGQGDSVALHLTADEPLSAHLHGYDIELHAAPGAPARAAFEARASGRFPVTRHGGASGGREKTLFYFEVLPR